MGSCSIEVDHLLLIESHKLSFLSIETQRKQVRDIVSIQINLDTANNTSAVAITASTGR